jgi:hypothetical protein
VNDFVVMSIQVFELDNLNILKTKKQYYDVKTAIEAENVSDSADFSVVGTYNYSKNSKLFRVYGSTRCSHPADSNQQRTAPV